MPMESCPFCGSEGQVETDGNLFWVACEECSAYGPVTLASALAVKLWDKRVRRDELVATRPGLPPAPYASSPEPEEPGRGPPTAI